MKLCKKCQTIKEDSDFYNNPRQSYACKSCLGAMTKIWVSKNREHLNKKARERRASNPEKYLKEGREYRSSLSVKIRSWKRQAERRGKQWNLVEDDFKNIPKTCFYTDVELTFESNKFNTISLDRVDSTKPYQSGNVVFCCWWINRMKSDKSPEQLVDMCSRVVDNKGKILNSIK